MDGDDFATWTSEFGDTPIVVANVENLTIESGASQSEFAAPSLRGLEETDQWKSDASEAVWSKAYHEAFSHNAATPVSRLGYRPLLSAAMLTLSSADDAANEQAETATDEAFAEWDALAALQA